MNRLRVCALLMGLLIGSLPLLSFSASISTTGAPVVVEVVTSGVTTNTTSGVKDVPNGPKSFYGQVVCSSGACTQTQQIYGTPYPTAVNGILLCTLTLSGTPSAVDACPVVTAAFSRIYVVTTNTTGTAATGAVYAMY